MSKTLMALFAAAGLCLAGASGAATNGTHDKAARDQAIKAADAAYKADKEACNSLSGNAKDVCMEEAKGKEKVAKAEAKAAYDGTPKAREDARLARAEATYEVAKEKCDERAGDSKTACVREAQAALARDKANAKQ